MEDLILLLIEPLVSDIKKISIEKIAEGDGVKFAVSVPKDEIAKVIGREGKMIKAIKNLVKIRAIKENMYVSIDVQEA